VQTGLCCVVVTWWLLFVNFGSSLCGGDGYMWPSQDRGGVNGWWGVLTYFALLLHLTGSLEMSHWCAAGP